MTIRFAAVHDLRVTTLAARIVAIVLFAGLIVFLGGTYFGHAPGPYGVCYGASGRPIPCALSSTPR